MEKIFISSVQNEFSEIRKLLVDYLRNDPLLGSFFEPFTFEDVPANTNNPCTVYSEQVADSNIYIGLFGEEYGYEDSEGSSPTEREYDIAKKEELPRWIFIKDARKRHHKEIELIKKIEQDVSRNKFNNFDSLKHEIYRLCMLYLQQKGKIVSHDFDDSLHPEATVEDLDKNKITEFVATARLKRNFPLKETDPADTILQHLRMLRADKLVNSALLVFTNDPQLYFPTATIKCAHFHGVKIQKPIPDYREYSGTVFEMAESAVDFVLSKINLSTGTRSKKNQVDTVYEIPRAVIAEAIINAVAHRDYKSNGSIQVSVFKDRIEISNPGSLPPELNIGDLKKPHSSYPANPLLASCMFLTGSIERYGTGTIDIYGLVKEKGLRAPAISLNEGIKLTLWRVSSTKKEDTTDYDTDYDETSISEVNSKLLLAVYGEMSRQ